MTDIPKWVTDLDKKALGMPFGEIDVKITRHRSTTSKVEYRKESKIEPKSNQQAFSDVEKLINTMVSGYFTGKLDFVLDFKNGTIQLVTIKNKEIKNYGPNR